jgi:hypothetical protein
MGLSTAFGHDVKGDETVEGSQRLDPEKLQALGKLFGGLGEPAARKRFLADPSAAIGGLPANVQELFSDLTDDELRVLVRTWNEMDKAGLTYDADGVTVSFL